MSVGVVDALEMVNITEKHGNISAGSEHFSVVMQIVGIETHAVFELGETIML